MEFVGQTQNFVGEAPVFVDMYLSLRAKEFRIFLKARILCLGVQDLSLRV